jgi:Asp-tRNA(Asn)/Glu-tRNA(Gln) amidotransferase A subunit family amidase
MRQGLSVSVEDYLAARRRRFAYARALDNLLGADRLLVTPTTPQQGFYADGREVGAKRPGTGVSSYNTQVQNMTGHPALSVPAGRSPNGVPFGLQITGPRFADALVLDIGDAWEKAHPGERVAPGFASFLPAG